MKDRQKINYSINGYFFTKVLFEAHRQPNENFENEIKVDWNIEATSLENDSIVIYLNVKSDGEVCDKTPYTIDIETTCVLTLKDKEEYTKELEAGLVRNAASICYGAIREKILSLSSRSVWGPAVIPPNYFIGLTAEKKEQS